MESIKSEQRETGGKMIILTEHNYEAWAALCMDHLLAYPGPWDWIKYGVESLFEPPLLEVPREQPARANQAARRAPAAEQGRRGDARRARNQRRGGAFQDFDEPEEQGDEDEDRAPADPGMMRNPRYQGEAGKDLWREELKDIAIERRKFKVDKNLAWAFIVKHIDAPIADKIKLTRDYDMHYAQHNVLFLWNACREVATGVGAQSAGIILGKAFKMKMDGENWGAHFKDVKDARRAFRRLQIRPDRIEDVLWNSIFVMSMAHTDNTVLRTEIDNVLSQQEWPQMDNLIARWTTMLTAKETMTNPAVHGAVQANVASSHMQRRKPVHRNTKCINCGQPGHMYAQCEEPVSKCAKCSGSHHTTMHEEVQSLRKARDERAGKAKQKLPDINSPKERISRMALSAKPEEAHDIDEHDAQLDAMIAVEESMKDEEDTNPSFIDEDGYGARIFIGGEMLKDDNVMCRLAKLDAEAVRMTEEEAAEAMKALSIMDDEQDEVIFDTGCTAHVLRCAEGLFDVRNAPPGSCIKGVGGTATIKHIGKMLGIGRVFVAPEGANLISMSQLANEGANFNGNKNELVVRDKEGLIMFVARPSANHRGLSVMKGIEFREACAAVSKRMELYFSDFVDGAGVRQSYVLTMNGLVKRTHFNSDVISRAKEARDLHRRMGHPSDMALGNALDNGVYPETNVTSRDLAAAADYYGPCTACMQGKMIADPQHPSDRDPVREIGEYVSVDLLPAKSASLGGNMQMVVSRDRLSSYVMCVPIKNKESASVLDALMRIKNFYSSHGHQVKNFVFDNEAVFNSVQRSIDYARCTYTPTDLHNKHIERLVRELKEKWRCMRADLPYKLPACLNFEGLMVAAQSINCLPNKQTGPTRTAVEIVTGKRPYARPYLTTTGR